MSRAVRAVRVDVLLEGPEKDGGPSLQGALLEHPARTFT